jgi:hypothetical protein
VLAKTGFLGESPALIRGAIFAARDASTLMVNDRCTLRYAKRDGDDAAGVSSRGRSDAELGLQEIVDGLRIGLAAR